MQWLSLLLWAALAVYGGRRPGRRAGTRILLSLGLALSMSGQLWLLWQDGLLTLSTGLPLHLCGMMALLSLWLLWRPTPWIYHACLLLGSPCAFLALCFPAMVACARPMLMSAHFNRLHGLIIACALFQAAQKKPLPQSALGVFIRGNGYLLLVECVNRLLNTNYLFLQNAPSGTPLALLFSRGPIFYLSALEWLSMLCLWAMLPFWQAVVPLLTGESTSACTQCSHCRIPCTTGSRESES